MVNYRQQQLRNVSLVLRKDQKTCLCQAQLLKEVVGASVANYVKLVLLWSILMNLYDVSFQKWEGFFFSSGTNLRSRRQLKRRSA